MYRSSSSGRLSQSPPRSSPSSLLPARSSPNLKLTLAGELPTFNPRSYIAAKERDRVRFAENAVHLIPLILVLSVIVLWLFSDPGIQSFINFNGPLA
nr:uncharacterized protein LOC109185335 isoform X2 [Ipomoea trifida]GMC50369.1 uncharacterized protein LOC109185335 isoform X2 [Ipomoea batatas]GMC80700.1 uncharacterized protein LOC109185335 isoform X2 [Ipomoea batatas]GMC85250.1 uncharacterized protein LOC109185335 isoform X2 [Ipomoea batatas]